jgi:signal transduction histidine kinase
MLFDKKKKEAPASENVEIQSITENLYKQNLELAVKNKTLSILGKLYEISIQELSSKELAQRITSVIQTDFEFERVGILTYDAANNSATVLAFSESERFKKAAHSVADDFFSAVSLPDISHHAFLGPIIKSKTRGYTEAIEELWASHIKPEEIEKIKKEGHVRSIIAYPLVIQDSVIGFFVLDLNRVYDDLVEYEKESIQNFANVISVAIDKARLYEELTISNENLAKANDQQVILIHFITHQLKGFVTKSRNIFSVLLEGDFGVLPETMKPMVEEGFRSDTKGAETIQEILNAANIKSGKVTYNMVPFDLKALVEEISNDLKPAATAKGIDLTLNLGDALEYNGDKAQLTNALKNLIDNSIKYTPSGSVKVSLAKEADKIHFEIKDTGVGITPEDMQHLFTEGGHGKESQKINVESTGFGLYIVKNIIDGHGGKIWAESEGTGKGSRFIIELPLK